MASSTSFSSDEDFKAYEDAESNLKNSKLFVIVRKDGVTECEIIKGLEDCLAQGADVNAQNQKGKTLLHIAIEKMLIFVIDFLLISGANPYIQNTNKKSAFDIAEELKHSEILQKLQKYCKTSPNLSGSSTSPDTKENDEKLKRFVIRFVKEFETKLEVFHSILEGIRKPKEGKFSETFAAKFGQCLGHYLGSYFGAGETVGILLGAITEKFGQVLGESLYKKKVKSLRELVYSFMGERSSFRNILTESGFQIFRNFEIVIINVTSDKNWRAVINKLAEDAANRTINYIAIEGIEKINEDVITKGVIYGDSKRNMLLMKGGFHINYQGLSNKNKDKKVGLKTAKIYSKAGIVRITDGAPNRYYRYKRSASSKYYQFIRGSKLNKYYYRLPFNWELKNLEEKLKTYYEEETSSVLQYTSMFENRNIEKLKNNLKSKINEENEQLTTDWMKSSMDELKCDLLKSFQEIIGKGDFSKKDIDLLDSFENAIKGLNFEGNVNELKNITVEKSDEIKEVIRMEGNITRGADLREHEITRTLIVQKFEELTKRINNDSHEIHTSNILFEVLEPVPSFIERKATELQDIHELLNESQNNDIYSHMVIISGFGGLGKSEFVRKYVKVYGKDYDNVIWLNSSSCETLKASFHMLAKTMKIDGCLTSDVSIVLLVNLIYRQLCKENRVSLFIFDNAEKLKSQSEDSGIFNFLPFSLPANLIKPHVIITTHRTDWDKAIKQIKLDPLWNRGTELLKNLLPTYNVEDQTEFIEKLVKKLGYLPLAIQLAASYINEHDMTVEEYYTQYKGRKKDLLHYQFPEGSADNYTMTIFRTWSMAFDKIKNSEKDKAAVEILYDFAFLIPDKSVKSMKPYLGKDNEVLSAIKTLKCYSLLNDNLQMNSLMQEVICIQLSETEQIEVLAKLLRSMKDRKEELQKNEEALQHAEYIWNSATGYESLIKEFYEFTNTFVKNGQNALHYACSQGHIKVIRFLIQERMVDVFAKDSAGKTVLHRASEAGRIEVVKYLTKEYPELVKVKDKYGVTALYRANQQAGNINVIIHLLQKGIEEEDDEDNKLWLRFLMKTAERNERNVLKYLIHTSPDFEMHHYDKVMFLHKAAQDGELDVVKYLVNSGAVDITSCSSRYVTALHEAVSGGNNKVIQFILDKLEEMFIYEKEKLMCWVNAADIDGDTPLMWAAQGGKIEAIKLLKKSGADVTIENNHGKTALWWAEKEGNLTEEMRDLLSQTTHPFYMRSKNEP